MENQYPKPTQDYKVVIRCHTYNQEAYIEDALNGFVRQKTNFPFCALVIDDCSTDHNADIIRKYEKQYPDIIKGVYLKENYYSQKKSQDPIAQPWIERTQYIAYCEGDDYWIDDYKLQRQVDFLDAHPDYLMHLHNALVRHQNHDVPDHLMSYFDTGDITTTLLFEKWQLPLASVVFRKSILETEMYRELSKTVHGGFLLFLTATKLGKVRGLSECLSVYRKNDGGVSHFMSPSYCMEVECGYAKSSGDIGAIKVMRKKMSINIRGWYYPYLRKEPEAIKVMNAIKMYYPDVFYLGFIRFLFNIPSKCVRRIKKRWQ